jgi:hypothetical protein
MTRDFEAQLHAIESARADVLLIDIANNGGGTEWAEAVARIVTAVRLNRSGLASCVDLIGPSNLRILSPTYASTPKALPGRTQTCSTG